MRTTRLVFDLDDTLYPERSHALAGFAAAGRFAEREWGLAGLADDLIRHLDDGHLGQCFALTLAERRPSFTQAELGAFAGAWRDHTPETLDLFGDAARILDRLAGRPIGLITDGSAGIQRGKVRALGLAPRFHTSIYTGALGPARAFHKPHPMAYEMMEQAMARQPGDRFVYIGDNPSKDFVTPNARGWTSVMVVRPHHAEHRIHKAAPVAVGGAPHMTLESLDDLPAGLLA